MKTLLSVLALLFGLQSQAGHDAYAKGEYEVALQAFTSAAESSSSGEAWFNVASAALAAGKVAVAEVAAERSVVAGGPAFAARRDFILGMATYKRFSPALMMTRLPEAGAPEMDRALDLGWDALWFFESASVRRGGWPEANRNHARVRLMVHALEIRREEARKKSGGKVRARKQRPRPSPDGRKRKKRPVKLNEKLLSKGEVRLLRDQLKARREKKESLRQANHVSSEAAGGTDW